MRILLAYCVTHGDGVRKDGSSYLKPKANLYTFFYKLDIKFRLVAIATTMCLNQSVVKNQDSKSYCSVYLLQAKKKKNTCAWKHLNKFLIFL